MLPLDTLDIHTGNPAIHSPCLSQPTPIRFYNGAPVYEFGYGLSYTTFTFTWSNSSLSFPAFKIQATLDDRMSLSFRIHFRLPFLAFYSRYNTEPLGALQAIVKNTGTVTSDVSVLAFVVGPNPGTNTFHRSHLLILSFYLGKNGNPLKSLVGFSRVYALTPGQSATVQFPVAAHQLRYPLSFTISLPSLS